jgi:thiamine-phosphate pyrophosphorylase
LSTRAARAARFRETDLYVVITEAFCAGRAPIDVLDACLGAGVRLIQLREKHLDGGALYALAAAFRARTAAADALLIIDDRVDIALAVGADGVHLGQSDLPLAVARRIAPELLLGSSSHDLEEARAAQEQGVDYVNIGPIFATQTKDVPTGVVGTAMIDVIRPHLHIPFTVMGGIKLHNVGEVLARGALHPAVVTAVTAAEDPAAAAAALRARILSDRA